MTEPVTRRTVVERPAVHLVAVVLAVVFLVIFTLIGFGTITARHADGWLGLGLVFLAASLVV